MPMSMKKCYGSRLTFRESSLYSPRVTKLDVLCRGERLLQYRRDHLLLVWPREDFTSKHICTWSLIILAHVSVRHKICIAHRRYHRSYSPVPDIYDKSAHTYCRKQTGTYQKIIQSTGESEHRLNNKRQRVGAGTLANNEADEGRCRMCV
ncbi:hypothetical protein K439DRAFT_846124 [Ramaria rubella]|nr:hypothetical protein K439DRAFT_846124 [Ramaria rubella]